MATAFLAGYTLSGKTALSRNSNIRSDESESGTLRFIDIGAQTYWLINAIFEVLNETEKDTLVDWLEANETTEIALVVGAKTYNGYIDPQSEIAASPLSDAPNLWEVSFLFKGVKQ